MKEYFVSLGPKSNGFYDQITGITVARGEKVKITERQKDTRKISMALNAGQLMLVQSDSQVTIISDDEVKKLDKKIKAQYEKGVTLDKISRGVTMDQVKLLAELHEISVDPDDTVKTVIEAIIEDYK